MTLPISEAETIIKLPDFRWTLERYHAAIAAGVLNSDDKVELLFGKLVPMSPIGILHGQVVKTINKTLMRRLLEEPYTVGVQDPITLMDDTEPEPDLFVARGLIGSYDHHPYPEDLLLVIEVSDSTLTRDRTAKKLIYATAGIEEYWIVNVYERQVERYTEPLPERGSYGKVEKFKAGDVFGSIYLGDFAVGELVVE